MITTTDALNTVEFKDYYVILPAALPDWDIEQFIQESNDAPGKYASDEFCYNSENNSRFLSVDELHQLIYAEDGK
jgi:hypothetical protein